MTGADSRFSRKCLALRKNSRLLSGKSSEDALHAASAMWLPLVRCWGGASPGLGYDAYRAGTVTATGTY